MTQPFTNDVAISAVGPLRAPFSSEDYQFETPVEDANNLAAAFYRAATGVDWKGSVQKYKIDLLSNLRRTQLDIIHNRYKLHPMVEFVLNERGHIRGIRAQHINDRTVQRCLNDNVLIPKVRPLLIYNNGASLKGKGLHFARKMFEIDLRNAYTEYGGEAYILMIDFSKYFDNIDHPGITDLFAKYLSRKDLELVKSCIRSFELDVSYLSDDEYEYAKNHPFNIVDHFKRKKTITPNSAGSKMLQKGMAIGNQISQIGGVFYPHRIDNYCKIVKGVKYYGRYMDDTYIICKTKEEALSLYEDIKKICVELKIHVNTTKTTVEHIGGWHTYLKINYLVTPTGGLIRKVHNSTIRRERRRLRLFKKLIDRHIMVFTDVLQCYKTWRGAYRKYDSGKSLYKLDKLFRRLFKYEISKCPYEVTFKKEVQ